MTSKYNLILKKTYKKYIGHMLEALEGFSIDLTIKTSLQSKEIESDVDSCYYFANTKLNSKNIDYGMVETRGFYKGNFLSFKNFSADVLSVTSREIQHSINRNIMFSSDISVSEVDSDYECCRAYSKSTGISILESIDSCIKKNFILKENKEKIKKILKLIDNYEKTHE